MRTDAALTLNDVPMLLKVMRDTIGASLEAHESASPSVRRDGFSQYLRSSSVMDEEEEETERGGGERPVWANDKVAPAPADKTPGFNA